LDSIKRGEGNGVTHLTERLKGRLTLRYIYERGEKEKTTTPTDERKREKKRKYR